MRSLTLDIALVFFTSSIALYLLSYKSHAKKAFLFSLLLFFSPVLLVIKESILSVFPAWVSILVLIVIGSIMLRYVFDLLFGESASHIAGDLISTTIKYLSELIIYIPKFILSNKWLHVTSKTIGKTIVLKCKELTLFISNFYNSLSTRFKKKRTKSAVKLVKKEADEGT